MTSDAFRPFDTHLDRDRALALLREAVAGADDGELFLERRRSEVLSLDDRRLRTAGFDASEGFGLRAVRGETAGYAHSTTIDERALSRAVATARLAVGAGGGTLAAAPAGTNRRLYTDADPLAGGSFAARTDLLREIDAFARALDPRVVQVSATLSASLQEVAILRPEGGLVTDIRPMARINVSVIVEENGRRESGGTGTGGRHGLEGLMAPATWQAAVREALRIATVNLGAVAAPAGVMDVVLGPGWPGILLHEAVGHGLEGDFNRKGASAFAGLMGQRVAAPGVTVLDDGTLPDRRGSLSVDDEGTPSARNVLIEDGILVGYMQDRQNARLMGVAPTGNGRRESFAHIPMPRMTNTYMRAGDAAPADLVAGLSDGIWAVGFGGGQVDITSGKFVFSCTEAYRVRGGRVQEAIKGATLIGDGATALRAVRGIGNDFALDPGIGNCGKAGQWVPVGVGQPSLLIGGLTVGGLRPERRERRRNRDSPAVNPDALDLILQQAEGRMAEATTSSTHPPLPPTKEEDRLDWLRLLRSRRVGIATFWRLLGEHGTARAALAALPDIARAAGIDDYAPCPVGVAASEMKAGRAAGARMVLRGDAGWPAMLDDIPDVPPMLWIRGDESLLSRPMLALVGARNASSLGMRMARALAADLGQAGYVVVSGLARGIDAAAHDAGLRTGTTAVMAGGVDVVYPTENTVLADRIAAHGLLLSEQPMGLQPQARHFPARNRIVAGLSRAVIVVEAAARSGSLITARTALDLGREVMAVPGHPMDPRAGGCNHLLRDGATLIRDAADVIEALGAPADRPVTIPAAPAGARAGTPAAPARSLRDTAALHRRILDRLGPAPIAEDQLIRDLAASAQSVAPVLTELELDGRIARAPGGMLLRLV